MGAPPTRNGSDAPNDATTYVRILSATTTNIRTPSSAPISTSSRAD